MKARVVDFLLTMSGKQRLTLELDADWRDQYDQLHSQELEVTIKKFSKKRTLDANAMYWSLLTTFAKKVGISNAQAHNDMLRRYGEVEIIDGRTVWLVLPDTDEAMQKADNAETYHLKPTSHVREGDDGEMYRTYLLLRGSKTYTTKEFKRLLNGLISECEAIGIPTLL